MAARCPKCEKLRPYLEGEFCEDCNHWIREREYWAKKRAYDKKNKKEEIKPKKREIYTICPRCDGIPNVYEQRCKCGWTG